jgi:hypothetical protein
VIWAGGTTSPHDDGWDRGDLDAGAGVGVEFSPGDELVGHRLRCGPRQDDPCAESKLVSEPLAARDQGLGPG